MLLFYVLLFLSAFVAADAQQSMKMLDHEVSRGDTTMDVLDWMSDDFLSGFDALLPISKSCSPNPAEGKHKKYKMNKYVLPLLVGFLLIKAILLPIALKALAVLSGKAVVLSLMSLILAAIVGLKKVAQKESSHESNNKYRRQDIHDFWNDLQEIEPYRFYKERRRKK